MMKSCALAVPLFLAAILPAAATTVSYNIAGSFTGTQLGTVTFDIDITLDTAITTNDTTSGLVVNSLSFTPDGGLAYQYNSNSDTLVFGGLIDGVNTVHTHESDFLVRIKDFSDAVNYEVTTITESASGQSGFGTVLTYSVTETPTTAVPLAPALPAATVGLGMLWIAGRRRAR